MVLLLILLVDVVLCFSYTGVRVMVEKKSPGRPRKHQPGSRTCGLMVPPDLFERVEKIAEQTGCSYQDVMLSMIGVGLKFWEQNVECTNLFKGVRG